MQNQIKSRKTLNKESVAKREPVLLAYNVSDRFEGGGTASTRQKWMNCDKNDNHSNHHDRHENTIMCMKGKQSVVVFCSPCRPLPKPAASVSIVTTLPPFQSTQLAASQLKTKAQNTHKQQQTIRIEWNCHQEESGASQRWTTTWLFFGQKKYWGIKSEAVRETLPT